MEDGECRDKISVRSVRQPKYFSKTLQDLIPARIVLYILSFTGSLVNVVLRIDMNMAIVAMVKLPPPQPNLVNKSQDSYCYSLPPRNATEFTGNNTIPLEDGEFDWSYKTQTVILGSFYWFYVLTQSLGGILTQKYGTKVAYGFGQLFTAICSFLIPQAAELHYSAVIFLRCVQGSASGLTWPAMYAVVGPWIPPSERSRFMSSFLGFYFGIGMAYPLFGFIISHSGWRFVFYTTGTIGVLWCLCWWLLAYDTPRKHPRILREELLYIESSIGNTVVEGKGMRVPWWSIITSIPCWAISITTFGRIWAAYTFINLGPLYMKTALGFSIQKNGFASGLPFFCSYIACVVFCYLADLLVNGNYIGLLNVRKLFTAISQIIPGILVLIIGFLGCHPATVVTLWFITVCCFSAAFAGAMASVVDIGPNLAGPITAFAQTIFMAASFLSAVINRLILKESPTLEDWQKVFALTTVVTSGTYVFFQVFGTADIQRWNYPDGKIPSPHTESELRPLKGESNGQREGGDEVKR